MCVWKECNYKIAIVCRSYLPTAYVVRWEGYVLTRVCPSVCLFTPGGVPGQVQVQAGGGVPCQGVPGQIQGGTLPQGGIQSGPGGGYPARSRWGVPCRGVPQKEYLICRDRYASCVHAGGLSCFLYFQSHHNLIVTIFVIRQLNKIYRSVIDWRRGYNYSDLNHLDEGTLGFDNHKKPVLDQSDCDHQDCVGNRLMQFTSHFIILY